MKAERRHELKENELIQWLYSVRDYVSAHGTTIWWTVIVVLAVLVAALYVVRSRAQESAQQWEELKGLSFADPTEGKEALEQLAALAREATDTSFALTCLNRQVGIALQLASQVESPPDRDLTEHARQACAELTRRFPNNPLAQGTALLGLATVEENLFVLDGDAAHKERCREHLQAVLERPKLAGMSFQLQATDRLAALDKTFTPVQFTPAPLPDEPPQAAPTAAGVPATVTPALPGEVPAPDPAPQPAEESAPGTGTEPTDAPAEPAGAPSED